MESDFFPKRWLIAVGLAFGMLQGLSEEIRDFSDSPFNHCLVLSSDILPIAFLMAVGEL